MASLKGMWELSCLRRMSGIVHMYATIETIPRVGKDVFASGAFYGFFQTGFQRGVRDAFTYVCILGDVR